MSSNIELLMQGLRKLAENAAPPAGLVRLLRQGRQSVVSTTPSPLAQLAHLAIRGPAKCWGAAPRFWRN